MQVTLGTHLILRPGTPVMARSPGVLQVGLDEPALRVSDDPAIRTLLRALARPGGVRPDEELSPCAAQVLRQLDESDLLVPVADTEKRPEATLVVLRAQFGPDAVRRQGARATQTVAVRADAVAGAALDPLLQQVGLHRVAADDLAATVQLVVTSGPVDRGLLDPLVRGSIPHLLVTGGAAGRRIGPFVQPGLTACLRCVDAHEALHDARRPLLLTQAAAAAVDLPPPRDPVLDQMALAWAVRDLTRYLEGDEPSTWSTTIDIGPVAGPEAIRWGRHPDCGCAWDQFTELP